MYFVRFVQWGNTNVLCGDESSITALINILEKQRIDFKVTSPYGEVKQEDRNWGKFYHWLTVADLLC
jgi:hypothetical protein